MLIAGSLGKRGLLLRRRRRRVVVVEGLEGQSLLLYQHYYRTPSFPGERRGREF